MAYGADVLLKSNTGERSVALEDFFKGPGFIASFRIERCGFMDLVLHSFAWVNLYVVANLPPIL
jgi:hypothetical protein